MKKDTSLVISVLQKHEIATLGVMVTYFTWITIFLFNLREAQAVIQTTVQKDIAQIKEDQTQIKSDQAVMLDYLINKRK